MEFLLAAVAIAIALWLARHRVLHPGDYLVAAVLAVLLALFVMVLTPSAHQSRELTELGAPLSAIARSEFFVAHGVKIASASLLFAVGACGGALLRRRMTPEQYT